MKNKYLILVALVVILFITSLLFWSNSNKKYIEGSVKIENWLTYKNNDLGVTFQYPSDWKISLEPGDIILISPDKTSRVWDGDGHGYYTYGVRVMSLGASYPAFPVDITEEYIQEEFSSIKNSFFIRTEKFSEINGDRVSLVYDVGHYNRSMLALKNIKDKTLQIEMGHLFTGYPTINEMVVFMGIVSSLKY